MEFKPHGYQKHAVRHLIEKPAAALFLDMGLGKTAITLTALNTLMFDYFEVSKPLIVAPKRVAESTWDREAEKWDHLKHLRFSKILGTQRQRLKALDADADVYVINRENVEWLVTHYGRKWPFDMLIIDELSSFKSSASRRFRALKKVRPLIKRVVGLTGTPAPNGLIDLWPQIYLLDRGERLGQTITGYRTRYFIPGRRRDHIVFEWIPVSEEAIYKKISDICISMKAADWLEMPERIDRTVKVTLPAKAKAAYKQLEREYLLPFSDGDITASTAAVLTGKLLQLANGAVYDEDSKVREIHDAKLEALADVIEAANGRPVLVFYTYRHDLERIRRRFTVRTLDSPKDIDDWNAGRIPILLTHPASAGHGLNLQAGGNIIVWFGLPHSLELYEQANARLHRQGQKNKVIIHHLVTEQTIDENVMRALARKSITQNDLMRAVKARLEEMKR